MTKQLRNNIAYSLNCLVMHIYSKPH